MTYYPRFSFPLLLLFVFIYLGGIVNVILAFRSIGWMFVVICIFSIHGYKWCRKCIFLKSRHSVLAFSRIKNNWLLYTPSNILVATLSSDSIITRYLMNLQFKTFEGRRYSTMLFINSLSELQWKKLYMQVNYELRFNPQNHAE